MKWNAFLEATKLQVLAIKFNIKTEYLKIELIILKKIIWIFTN